jgi:hypothetical protein
MKKSIVKAGILIAVVSALGLGLGENPKGGDEPRREGAPTTPAAPAESVAQPVAPTNAPAPPPVPAPKAEAPDKSAPDKAAPASTNVPPPRLVQTAAAPSNLNLSPGLMEIVKMVQAGVSEEVLLAYIGNSTNIFDVSSDSIVYLNDLGVAGPVLTTLIQHDGSPDTMARKQAAVAMNPLPPQLKLTSPATNIYPTSTPPAATGEEVPGNFAYSQPVAAPPPEPTPVADNQAVTVVTQQVTNVTYFYDSLAPYGNWVSVPNYGVCWQPTVAVIDNAWRPYSDNGRWIWSDAGWYWYSYYSWGWAPFHYGRWSSYPGYGWLWVPGTSWGPSWVTWRYTPYYCGWAPLPPSCGYVNGFGLYYGGGGVGVNFGFGFGCDYYNFVPTAYFCTPNPYRYRVPYGQAQGIYKDSVVVNNYINGNNNTIINNGIGLDRVAKVHRGEIPQATIRDSAYSRAHGVRLERLEYHDSGMSIARPTLPKQPPISPAALAAHTQTEVAKDRALREPARAIRPAAPTGRAVPSAADTAPGAAKPDGLAAGTPRVRPDSRSGLTPLQSPRMASERPQPARAQPLTASPQNAQGSAPTVQGAPSPNSGVAERPQAPASQSPSGAAVRSTQPPQERPSRPNPSPTAVPGRSTAPGTAAAGVAPTRPERPAVPGSTAPAARAAAPPGRPTAPAQSVPSPRAVPSSSFYSAQSVNPGSPAIGRAPSAVPMAPSAPMVAPSRPAPAPSFRAEPSAPSRSFSAPSVSAPSVSAPSRPAPAPTASPSPSRSSGGGSVSRPGRPNR